MSLHTAADLINIRLIVQYGIFICLLSWRCAGILAWHQPHHVLFAIRIASGLSTGGWQMDRKIALHYEPCALVFFFIVELLIIQRLMNELALFRHLSGHKRIL